MKSKLIQRILFITFSLIIIFTFSLTSYADNYNYQDYADEPVDYGEYKLYNIRFITPLFIKNGVPEASPTSWTVVFSPWGVTDNGQPRNFMTYVGIGAQFQITTPNIPGLWKLNYTVDGGKTYTLLELRNDSNNPGLFTVNVPRDGSFGFVLTGLELNAEPFISGFGVSLRRNNSLTWEQAGELADVVHDASFKLPSLEPITKLISWVSLDPQALSVFAAIWAIILPENGIFYPIIGAVIAFSVLGYLLYGRR